MCHRDRNRDEAFLSDRQQTFNKVRGFLDQDLGALDPPPKDAYEMIMDFIKYVMRKIFGVEQNLESVLRSLALAKGFKVKNVFPMCSICCGQSYSDDVRSLRPMQMSCCHIFHFGCIEDASEAPCTEAPPNFKSEMQQCVGITHMLCPLCREDVVFPGRVLANV